MTRKAKETERILLFNNFQKACEVRRRIVNVCGIANNTVIPICKALKMQILKPSVLQWVDDEEAFKEAYIKKSKRDAGEVGSFVHRVIVDAAESDFDTQLKFYPYQVIRGVTKLTDEEEKLITLKGERMAVDEAKLEEYTNVYLTDPARIEVYHKCEQLCEYLNEFFAGNIPANDAFNRWASYVYPTPEGFKVNGRADFGELINNNKTKTL